MEQIHLFPYDPAWPNIYRTEEALVRSCLIRPPLLIEHMGSTAVPGLAAKPIVDIIVLVDELEHGRAAIPALETTGYSYWSANPDTTKLYLVKGLPPAPRRTHHLHIYHHAGEVARHLLFRDHLRANPEAVKAYLALKQDLATRFRDDREAYSKHKTAFIDALVLSLGGPPRRTDWNP
ncbi:GrpB family protein [Devosia rhodophyticola]|uniref:GrpB family protein n=1 Tax=Devosia rhodophyticola TaxID=3026423 RepID=A0ABY7Z0H5_9HYPH|nr:GrpB family protein [Devosia rhodophyticola]WDR06912.1 GrpB family protein [Devosia rhodophyticola]